MQDSKIEMDKVEEPMPKWLEDIYTYGWIIIMFIIFFFAVWYMRYLGK